MVGVPAGTDLPEWGPSGEELIAACGKKMTGGGVEVIEDGYDVEFEEQADGLLVEHLDSLRIHENY